MSRPTNSSLQIHIDGAARGNPGPAGIGAVLAGGKGRVLKEVSVYLGEATNNVAESCALIIALQEALKLDCRKVNVFTDSELLARQVTGEYRVKDKQLQWLHQLIQNLIGAFRQFEIQHVPREENRKADRLANRAINDYLKRHPRPTSSKAVPASVTDPRQPTLFG